jgi:hypothetical protein
VSIVTHDSLGSFIYNHYREALDVIRTNSAELAEIQAHLQIADGDFEVYLNEERAYLHSLTRELPEDTLRFDYVEALDDLAKARYVFSLYYSIWIDFAEQQR